MRPTANGCPPSLRNDDPERAIRPHATPCANPGHSPDYRLVFWTASRLLSAERVHQRLIDPDDRRDVDRVRFMVANDLSGPADRLDPNAFDQAISDAIRSYV